MSDEDMPALEEDIPALEQESPSGNVVLESMFNNYKMATSAQIIGRGETDWYKFCSSVITNLKKDGFDEALLDEFLICHIIQALMFNDVFNVINYIYGLSKLSLFEEKIKNYFESNYMTNKGITGILLQDWVKKPVAKPVSQLIILDKKTNTWNLAEPEDFEDLQPIIEQNIITRNTLNNVVGFITNFRNDYMIFKTKQLDKPRTKGARCDQMPRPLIIKILNSIIARDPIHEARNPYNYTYNPSEFTIENTKSFNVIYLCILQEFILRLYNNDRKYGKCWFLDPTQSVIIDIDNLK